MTDIRRVGVAARYSDLVISGGVARFSGYVPETALDGDIGAQTKDVLDQIDQSLAEIGSDKTKILTATIWLADIKDFAGLNVVWDAWAAQGHTPARACVQAKLANPDIKVEIMVTAAV